MKIQGLKSGTPAHKLDRDKSEVRPDFGQIIKGVLNKVNNSEMAANRSIADLLHGKADIHETMIALQKADISMRMLLTVRNKVIEAYREIMRMQF